MKKLSGLLMVIVLMLSALHAVGIRQGLAQSTADNSAANEKPSGIGVPHTGYGWQVILDSATFDTNHSVSGLSLINGSLSFTTTTYTAPEGLGYLAVELDTRNLLDKPSFETSDIWLLGENGDRWSPDSELSDLPVEVVFSVATSEANQAFELQLGDLTIPLPIGKEASNETKTTVEVKSAESVKGCAVGTIPEPDAQGQVVFYRETEAGEVLIGTIPMSTMAETVICDQVAYGELQIASNGAAILVTSPAQGWQNLYAVEPGGNIHMLVENGLNIKAGFDPSERWVVFSTENVGTGDKSLYSFDWETLSVHSIQSSSDLSFEFLTDGRLVIDYDDEAGERQYVVGSAEGTAFEPVNLPADVANFARLTPDGQHITYSEFGGNFDFTIMMLAERDGSHARALAQSNDLRLIHQISPDSQTVLMSLGQGEGLKNQLEFLDIATGETTVIAPEIDNLPRLAFSSNGQWGAAVVKENGMPAVYVIHIADGSFQKIEDGTSIFFSSNNNQAVYTEVSTGEPVMHMLSLGDGATQLLGSGVLSGWYGAATMNG